MYMIFFVLHNTELSKDIMDAWQAAGVNGVTILASTGLARIKEVFLRDDLPLIPNFDEIMSHTDEALNRTFITIVQDDVMVERVIAATESITGDLDLPNTGILAVLPLVRVHGLNRKKL